MDHVLDNPIWNALSTGNRNLAFGNDKALYIKRDVGFFAGLKTNSIENIAALHHLISPGTTVYLFIDGEVPVSSKWQVHKKTGILQMVLHSGKTVINKSDDIVPLYDKDIPAMIELTKLTNPGPFLSRSIDYGNYEGIFNNDQLIAMAGQRLQPDPYTEVSAVCTHPDHTGKGYAARLIINQINKIINDSRVPFLHVYPDNDSAIKLYKKLGFSVRKELTLYVLNS